MSQTTTPDGVAGHRDDAPIHHDATAMPRPAIGAGRVGTRRRRVVSSVGGGVLCVVALVLLAGGAIRRANHSPGSAPDEPHESTSGGVPQALGPNEEVRRRPEPTDSGGTSPRRDEGVP
jgi:hypothetical protein